MSEPPDDFDKLWVEILDEWDKAEEALKQTEMVSGEVCIPAINELRYAGRRLVDALRHRDENPGKAHDLLRNARFDCHRARHDAVDAATAFMQEMVNIAARHFSARNFRESFADITTLRTRLNEVRNKISQSRRYRGERDAIYDTIQKTDLDELISLYQRFEASEILLAKTAEEENRIAEAEKRAAEEEKKEKRRAVIGMYVSLAVGIAGVLVGLLATLIG